MAKRTKVVYGVGINDSLGKTSKCKVYKTWYSLMARCFSEKVRVRLPTYKDCTVASEWLKFSSFKSWMDSCDHSGKELDKDLLFAGNKHYSPETCVFISHALNTFLTKADAIRGDHPLGVMYRKDNDNYRARISDGGRMVSLGSFETAEEAHEAYSAAKYELAVKFAEAETDPLIKSAILNMFKGESYGC